MIPGTKLLIDTDIGSDIDDALALLLASHLEEVEIVGVTTVYGQVDVRARVAHRILRQAGVSAPVVRGLGTPRGSAMPVWHSGTEGKGLLSEADLAVPLHDLGILEDAPGFIIEQVFSHPGEVILVSLGPLTNVAAAMERESRLANVARGLYFMGGGISYPDSVPSSLESGITYCARPSHNVRCDVAASRLVFESCMPITVLTNDVTTRIWWDGSPVQELLGATSPPEVAAVGKLMRVWLDYRSVIFGKPITGTCPHDPLTVAEAAGEHFVDYVNGQMRIHRDATTSFIPDPVGHHRAAARVDAGGFERWMSSMLLASSTAS